MRTIVPLTLVLCFSQFFGGCLPNPVVLSSALTSTDVARGRLGRSLSVQKSGHGWVSVGTRQVFLVSDQVKEDDAAGSLTEAKARDAVARLALATAKDACRVSGDYVNSKLTTLSMTFIKELSPSNLVRRQPTVAACCKPDGGVTEQCDGLRVITKFIKTKVRFKLASSWNAGNELQCKVGRSGQTSDFSLNAKLSGNGQFDVQSEGWNVAQWSDIAEICATPPALVRPKGCSWKIQDLFNGSLALTPQTSSPAHRLRCREMAGATNGTLKFQGKVRLKRPGLPNNGAHHPRRLHFGMTADGQCPDGSCTVQTPSFNGGSGRNCAPTGCMQTLTIQLNSKQLEGLSAGGVKFMMRNRNLTFWGAQNAAPGPATLVFEAGGVISIVP